MQRYETLWECIGNGEQVSASLVAIVSAILLSAALSMADDAVLEAWDTSCAALQTQLKIGTEHALTRAHVLQSTRLEVLQAFVAHMVRSLVYY
jgi:type II secretory pathway predicted ATPase ExeA